MTEMKIEAHLVKVKDKDSSPENFQKTMGVIRDNYSDLLDKDGFSIRGIDGEYQSYVFNCPLFKTHKLIIKNLKVASINDEKDTPIVITPIGDDFQLAEKTE